MPTDIGLTAEQRKGVVGMLTALLADEGPLYAKTRNYHWNVIGPQFNDLHKFFEAQYAAPEHIVDDVAERGRILGGNAIGTPSEFLKHTRLQEHPGEYPGAQEMLINLLGDHQATIRQLPMELQGCADMYHDMGTNDFLTGLMEWHEKMAWMLRSFIEGSGV